MNNLLIFFFFISFFVNVITIFYLYKFCLVILNLETEIEKSIDILDKNYKNISKILDREVFFDSIEVRNVIASIKGCKDAILNVANVLTKDTRLIGEKDTEKENKGS
jgi:hypothetical protein